MHVCTLGSRDLLVGDVADERVAEDVLVLAGDGRSELAAYEFLPLERVQPLLERPPLAPESAEPEDTARRLRHPGGAPSPRVGSVSSRAAIMPLHRLGNDGLGGTLDAACGRTPPRTADCRPRARAAMPARRRRSPSAPSRARARASTVSSSESGERRIVDELTFPPPQPGRRVEELRASGAERRAAARPSPSRRGSRRSRACASSAQWRSSKTRTSGRSSASASRKRRQAANASSRWSPEPLLVSVEPGERPRWRSTQPASAASRRADSTAWRSFSAACVGRRTRGSRPAP